MAWLREDDTYPGFVTWLAERRKVRGVLWVRATGADGKADREALERICQQRGLTVTHDGVLQMLVVEDVPIWTRSPGGAVRGLNWTNPDTGEVVRPDLAIIDDLETRDTARSKTQTDNIETWLFSDALQTGDQTHPLRTILLGTPITPTCLISKAMRQEPPFDRWDEPLIVPIRGRGGDPNWPEVFDPELELRVPALTWATEYKLETVPAGTLYFPPNLTVWRDTPERLPVIVGVDPAGDGADSTGIAAVGQAPDGLHVVDAMAWAGAAADMPAQVAAFVAGYKRRGIRSKVSCSRRTAGRGSGRHGKLGTCWLRSGCKPSHRGCRRVSVRSRSRSGIGSGSSPCRRICEARRPIPSCIRLRWMSRRSPVTTTCSTPSCGAVAS